MLCLVYCEMGGHTKEGWSGLLARVSCPSVPHRRESDRDRLMSKLISDQQVVEVPRTLRVERENRIAACLIVHSGM